MLNRRAFIGAKPATPVPGGGEVPTSASESYTTCAGGSRHHVTVNMGNVRPLTARDRDELADLIGKSLTSQMQRSGVPR